jgi:long-chain fatty acid transport protein
MSRINNKHVALVLLAAIGAGNSYAAGFQLFEQGVSGLGTAYASGAAAEDASTIFWNPAGMTYLPGKNLSVGLHLIKPTAKFENQGSSFPNLPPAVGPVTGGNGGDAGDVAPVPNAFYSHAINDQLRVGVGLSSIFGLKTEYDDNWVGRYQATVSDLRTININPSLAYRINDKFSIGGGLNIVRADVELSNALNFGLIGGLQVPAALGGPVLSQNQLRDGKVKLEGDDWAYGFNLGLMAQVTPSARIGFAFRSKVKVEVKGDADFTVPNLSPPFPAAINAGVQAAFSDTGVKATVELPEIVSLNTHVQLNDRWAVMSDLTWTNWSRFEELRIKFDAPGRADSVTPEQWKDSYKLALGASFKLSEKWTLRGGVAYDKSPVKDEFRTPRIPDGDRTWLAFGARLNLSDHNSLDFGFAHIFIDDPELNKTSDESVPQLRTLLRGEYDADVNILSVQYNHRF